MRTLLILICGFFLISIIMFLSYVSIEFIVGNKYIRFSLLFEEALLDSIYPYCVVIILGYLISPKK